MSHPTFNAGDDLELRTGLAAPVPSLTSALASPDALTIVSDPLLGQQFPLAGPDVPARTEIVFIESNVGNIDVLRQGIGVGKEIYVLDASQDGLQQIAHILAGRNGIDALHLITHGSEASLNLGSLLLNQSSIEDHQSELQAIGESLNQDADILLYGCNIGVGRGIEFIEQLATLSGADIAASNDLTGSSKLGGDWELEVRQGDVADPIPLNSATLQNFTGLLSAYTGIIGFDTDNKGDGSYSSKQDATAPAGPYTLTLDSDTAKTQVYGSYKLYGQIGAAFLGDGSTAQNSVTLSFGGGNTFQPQSINLFNQTSNGKGDFRITGGSKYVDVSFSSTQVWQNVDLTSLGTVSSLVIARPSGGATFVQLNIDDFSIKDLKSAATPAITSATYDASTNVLSVTATDMTSGDTILPSKLTVKGENGNTYTLTSSSVKASSATAFSITLNAADQLAVEGLLNKTGTTSAGSGTTFNLEAASGWDSTASSAPADATNAITVSSVSSPTVSTADYNAATGVLTVTGSGFVATSGSANDVTVANLTLKGQSGSTYTLTSSDVEAISTTSFSVTLNATDKIAVNGLMNQNGGYSLDSTTYNIAAASGWNSGLASADLTANTVSVSGVASPAISSAAYDASTGILTVTGTDFVGTVGSLNDISASKLTIKGQGGDTYTLTTSDVEITSATSFAITLSSTDKIAINGLLNKVGSKAIDSTTFNLSASSGWNSALAADDASNSMTVTNVTGPVISKATYNANTGSLVVTGTNFVGKVGATNDVTVGKLTLKGEGDNSYTLTSGDVEVTSATEFTVALNAVDKLFINGLMNKVGTKSVDSTTYNIAASSSWNTALASVDTTNGVTASNIQTPTITSASYNTLTGVLSVTGTNLVAMVGSNNDVFASNLTFKGKGNSTYTLTSNDVDITDATSFTITLNSTDIAGLAAIFDKNGSKASDNVTYNLAASDDWNSAIADGDISDTTNAVTVTTPAPAVTKVVQTSGNGYYKASDTVTIAVYFDQNVTVDTVGGTPRLLLETGSTDEYATYTSGSGSKILTFSYTVQAGNESSDLQYFDTSALGVNGGTLKATSDSAVDASLTLPGLASGNSLAELSAVIVDTTAPSDSAPDLDASSDSGSSDTDDITNDTTPTFSGNGEANATIKLYDSDGSTLLGTTTADGSGKWSVTSTALSDGDHTIKTTVTDAAGNVSSVASLLVTIDTTAPSTPTGLDMAAASDSGYKNNDNITNKTTPTLSLVAEANISVSLYDTDGTTVLKTGTSNGTGKWSFATPALSEGVHAITAKATDLAGNVSSASSKLDVTIDLSPPTGTPATPVLSTSDDSGNSNTDGVTSNDSPGLSGTAEANGYVEVYNGTDPTPLATFAVDGSGKWSNSLSGLAEGSYAFFVKEYDAAGNVNSTVSATKTVVVDTTAPTTPGAPDLTSASDLGASNSDDITSATTPVFSGTAEADAIVKLYDTDGTTELGSTTADGSGKWSLTASTMSEGTHTVKVKATDLAGNESSLSSGLNVTIDTKAPTVVIDTLKFSADTGTSSTDFITKTAAQTVSGTVDADLAVDETVQVSLDNGATWSDATGASGQKSWSLSGVTLSASDTLKVRVVDAAGNAGTVKSQAYVLDTKAPSAPTTDLDSASDTGSSSTDDNTSTLTPTITGTAEANASITLYDTDGSTVLGTTTADGSGNWSVTSSTLSEGSHSLTAKATDLAGNEGSASSKLTVTIDATAPSAPGTPDLDSGSDSGSSNSDDITQTTAPTLTGTAEANASVSLYDTDGSTVLGTATADGSGKWSITSSKLSEGAHTLTAKASDTAGNLSKASGSLSVTVDLTAPSTPAAPTLAAASDTGNSSSDGITNLTALEFSGTTEALAAITLLDTDGSTVLGTATADGSGKWSTTTSKLATGAHTITVKSTDAAGNVSLASSGTAVTIDQTAPALSKAISISDTSLKVGDTATVKFIFTEKVSGFTAADVTVENGKLTGLSSSDGGITWAGTLTPTTNITDTANILTLDNTGYTDLAGNAGVGSSNSPNYSIDTEAPTLASSISISDTALKVGDTATVTIVFTEAVTGFTAADVTVGKGALSNLTSGDGGITWTATLTPSSDTESSTNALTLDMTGVTDLNGNVGVGTQDSGNYAVDTKRPSVSVGLSDSKLALGETATVTFTFNEAVSGFTTADVQAKNGTLSNLTTSDGGTTWTATFTPDNGVTATTNVITVDTTGVTDAAGNAGSASTDSGNYEIDQEAPTVKIKISDTSLKVGDTATVTFTFSEAIVGFANDDLKIANGSLSSVSTSDGGTTWTATLTPTSDIEDASNVITLDNSGVKDAAGNAGSGTTNSPNYAIDTKRPALASSITVSDTALKVGETATVTITFAEAISGFTAADLTVGNGTLSGLTSSDGGITWTATLTPTSNIEDASNVITLDYSGVTDLAGNVGTGSVDSGNYAIDTKRPALASSIKISDTALKMGDSATVTFTFEEAVTGFTTADLSVGNGVLSNLTTSDGGITWTATLTPDNNIEDTSNVITLDNTGYTDLAGNVGTGNSDSGNYAVDTKRPALASSITVSDTALKVGDTATVTIVFTEAVTGFTAADVTVGKGALSNLTSGDGGITWTATLTPSSNTESSTNVLTLDYTGVSDLAGNPGTGSVDSGNYAVDTQRPSATITLSDSKLTAGETATVTVKFSEAVTGFTNADLSVPNGKLDNVASSDGGTTWTATYTPTDQLLDLTNTITLDNSGVSDLAGNAGTGNSDSANYEIDTTMALTSASYDVSTGVLTVTGYNMGTGDTIDVSKLSLVGEDASSYTLTSGNVKTSSSTSFAITLNPADQAALSPLLNKIGTTATGGATYNLAGAAGWNQTAGSGADLSGNALTVSNVPAPTLTSATYNASSGALVLTGTGLLSLAGKANEIIAGKLSFSGEGASTYTLTDTANVDISSATSATLTLSSTDQAALNQILNKNGTSATGGATYNIAAAEDWMAGAEASVNVADLSGNAITVSGVAAPTLTSATYNATTGTLVVSASGLLKLAGAGNEIIANKFTFTGEGGQTYTLSTTANVDITDGSSFTLVLSDVDRQALNQLMNKAGANATGGSTYNIAAAEDWAAGAEASVNVADLSGNAVTVSNVPLPTLTSATYDAATGVLKVSGTNLVKLGGAANDIDISKLKITGEAGASYTLSSAVDVELSSGTEFALTLDATDRNQVELLLTAGGTKAKDGTVYLISGLEDWAAGAEASVNVADLTGNGIAVTLPASTDQLIDGTKVSTTAQLNGDGTTTTTTTVTPVSGSRQDTNPATALADIPLATSAGDTLLQVSLPVGVGVTAEATSGGTLGLRQKLINASQPRVQLPADFSQILDTGIDAYVPTVGDQAQVTVRTVTLTTGSAGGTGSTPPAQPIVITGATGTGEADAAHPQRQEALVIDARNLPAGTVLDLRNVEFAIVIGPSRLVGGSGANVVVGDGSQQFIVLGPEDDVLRGGAGDDTVGSKSGNDKLYGDEGNDWVVGGAGNDQLEGGSGNDILQGGQSDAGTWTFTLNRQGQIVSSYAAKEAELAEAGSYSRVGSWAGADGSRTSDDRLAFSYERTDTVKAVATLFNAVLGRLPTVAELNQFATAGLNASQLAELGYSHYLASHAQPVGQSLASQVQALVTQVWGAANVSQEIVNTGVTYISQGGRWADGLLWLSQQSQATGRISDGSGNLALAQSLVVGETGWSSDTGADTLLGGAGNDVLVGGRGNDWLDGGEGLDMAVYSGRITDYTFHQQRVNGQLQTIVSNRYTGEVDTLIGIEYGQVGSKYYGLGMNAQGLPPLGQEVAMADYVMEFTQTQIALVGIPV